MFEKSNLLLRLATGKMPAVPAAHFANELSTNSNTVANLRG
jgi:hypothetical protein